MHTAASTPGQEPEASRRTSTQGRLGSARHTGGNAASAPRQEPGASARTVTQRHPRPAALTGGNAASRARWRRSRQAAMCALAASSSARARAAALPRPATRRMLSVPAALPALLHSRSAGAHHVAGMLVSRCWSHSSTARGKATGPCFRSMQTAEPRRSHHCGHACLHFKRSHAWSHQKARTARLFAATTKGFGGQDGSAWW